MMKAEKLTAEILRAKDYDEGEWIFYNKIYNVFLKQPIALVEQEGKFFFRYQLCVMTLKSEIETVEELETLERLIR